MCKYTLRLFFAVFIVCIAHSGRLRPAAVLSVRTVTVAAQSTVLAAQFLNLPSAQHIIADVYGNVYADDGTTVVRYSNTSNLFPSVADLAFPGAGQIRCIDQAGQVYSTNGLSVYALNPTTRTTTLLPQQFGFASAAALNESGSNLDALILAVNSTNAPGDATGVWKLKAAPSQLFNHSGMTADVFWFPNGIIGEYIACCFETGELVIVTRNIDSGYTPIGIYTLSAVPHGELRLIATIDWGNPYTSPSMDLIIANDTAILLCYYQRSQLAEHSSALLTVFAVNPLGKVTVIGNMSSDISSPSTYGRVGLAIGESSLYVASILDLFVIDNWYDAVELDLTAPLSLRPILQQDRAFRPLWIRTFPRIGMVIALYTDTGYSLSVLQPNGTLSTFSRTTALYGSVAVTKAGLVVGQIGDAKLAFGEIIGSAWPTTWKTFAGAQHFEGVALDSGGSLFFSTSSQIWKSQSLENPSNHAVSVFSPPTSLAITGDLIWCEDSDTFVTSLCDPTNELPCALHRIFLNGTSLSIFTFPFETKMQSLSLDTNGTIYVSWSGIFTSDPSECGTAVLTMYATGKIESFPHQEIGHCLTSISAARELVYFSGSLNVSAPSLRLLKSELSLGLIPTVGAWWTNGSLAVSGNPRPLEFPSALACDAQNNSWVASQSSYSEVGQDPHFYALNEMSSTNIRAFSIARPSVNQAFVFDQVSSFVMDSKNRVSWLSSLEVWPRETAAAIPQGTINGITNMLIAFPNLPTAIFALPDRSLLILDSFDFGGEAVGRIIRMVVCNDSAHFEFVAQTESLVTMATGRGGSIFAADMKGQLWQYAMNGSSQVIASSLTVLPDTILSLAVDSYQNLFYSRTGSVGMLTRMIANWSTSDSVIAWQLPEQYLFEAEVLTLSLDERDILFALSRVMCVLLLIDWKNHSFTTVYDFAANYMCNIRTCDGLTFNGTLALVSCILSGSSSHSIQAFDVTAAASSNSTAPQQIPDSINGDGPVTADGSGTVYFLRKGIIVKIDPGSAPRTVSDVELSQPATLALGLYDELYITNPAQGNIIKINSDGKPSVWLQNRFFPTGIAVSPQGLVALSEADPQGDPWQNGTSSNNPWYFVNILTPNGTLLSSTRITGQWYPQFGTLAFDAVDTRLYIGIATADRTIVWSWDGVSGNTPTQLMQVSRDLGVQAWSLTSCRQGETQLLIGNWIVQLKPCAPGYDCQTVPASLCAFGYFCIDGKVTACSPGQYAPSTGMTSCLTCSPGSAQPDSGAAECVSCDVGFEALVPAASSCSPCEQFTFASGPGTCTPCQSDGCTGSSECDVAYTGNLCSSCRPSYFATFNQQSGLMTCSPCAKISWWVALVTAVLILGVVLVLLKLNSSPAFVVMILPLNIGTSYLQLITFIGAIKLQWSNGAIQTLGVVNCISGGSLQALAAQTRCELSFPVVYLSTLCAPFMAAVLLGLTQTISLRNTGRPECCPRSIFAILSRARASLYSMRDRIIASFLSLLSLSYVPVAWTAFRVFDCVKIRGAHYVRDFVQLKCGSHEWWPYAGTSIALSIVFVVGAPLLQMRLATHSRSEAWLASSLSTLHKSCRWWLPAAQVWRLACVLVLRLLQATPIAQVSLFIFLFVSRFAFVIRWQPYINRYNIHQEISQFCLSAAVLLCALIFVLLNSPGTAAQRFLFVFVVTIISVQFITVAYFMRIAFKDFKRCQALDQTTRVAGMELGTEESSESKTGKASTVVTLAARSDDDIELVQNANSTYANDVEHPNISVPSDRDTTRTVRTTLH